MNGWLSTSGNELAKKKIDMLLERYQERSIVKQMEVLYNGEGVEIEPVEDISINDLDDIEGVLSLLLYAGYLTFEYKGKEGERKDKRLKVKIPNEEVREVYISVQKKMLSARYWDDGFIELMESIEKVSEKEIEKRMKSQLMDASFHDFSGENLEKDYHNFVHGMIRALVRRYEIRSNREVGMGRCDIILIPRGVLKEEGIILEFKAEKKKEEKGDRKGAKGKGKKKVEESREKRAEKISKEAIEQIKREEYPEEMRKRGVKKLRMIGMGFVDKIVGVKIENKKL